MDYCDCDMQDENLQSTEEYNSGSFSNEENSGQNISFTGHIDDLYDHEINHANDRLVNHTEDLLHARTQHEAQSALDHIKGDRNSIDYWENAKQEALTESKKNDIFIDGINAKLEIIEKYRK